MSSWSEQGRIYVLVICYKCFLFYSSSAIWWFLSSLMTALTRNCMRSLFVFTDGRFRMFTKLTLEAPPTSPIFTVQIIFVEWLHNRDMRWAGHISHMKGWQVYILKSPCAHSWYALVRKRTGKLVRRGQYADSSCVLTLGPDSSVEVITVRVKMFKKTTCVYRLHNKRLILIEYGCWFVYMSFART